MLGWLVPLIGLIWCLGRILYAAGYVADANRRHLGFAICIFSVLISMSATTCRICS